MDPELEKKIEQMKKFSFTDFAQNNPAQEFGSGVTPEQRAQLRFSVAGKNAVVTGGAQGLGLASSEALLEHGLDGVLLLDLNEESLAKGKAYLQAKFPNQTIATKKVDVSNVDQVKAAAEYSSEVLQSVDIVLTFAGIVSPHNIVDKTPEAWDNICNITINGTFYAAKYFGQKMIEQGHGGSIVLVSSVAGHSRSFPPIPSSYHTVKSAILGMRASVAQEYAPYGIRVNSISPGFIKTPMTQTDASKFLTEASARVTPLGRTGETHELAGPILLLCSDAGSYLTGTDLIVDGGISSLV